MGNVLSKVLLMANAGVAVHEHTRAGKHHLVVFTNHHLFNLMCFIQVSGRRITFCYRRLVPPSSPKRTFSKHVMNDMIHEMKCVIEVGSV